MKKNILLFANVGTDRNEYCHVGDEAMFWETFYFYQKRFPQVQLYSLVSLPSKHHQKIIEQRGLGWPDEKKAAFSYLIKLLFKTYTFKKLHISLFTEEQNVFIQFIKKQDLINFVGGGNITSECGHWFYYALLVAGVSELLGKPVILSSQTIGPFSSWIDRKLATLILNSTQSISIRESDEKQLPKLKAMGISRPLLSYAPDSAYFFKTQFMTLPKKFIHSSKILRIGLSLHQRGNNMSDFKNILQGLLSSVLKKYSLVELLLLPHILDKNNDFDIQFLKDLTADLPSSVKVISPEYFIYAKNTIEITELVKLLTGTCDIVLASRYHGLIFSLSQAIPCISIFDGKYQFMKNSAALQFMFDEKFSNFMISLKKPNSSKKLTTIFFRVLSQKTELHRIMKLRNRRLMEEHLQSFESLSFQINNL